MTETIYKKSIINKLYSNLNILAKNRCKSGKKGIEFQKCYLQALSDNANTIIMKLRSQLTKCPRTENPEECRENIQSLIDYLESKQRESESQIDQLEDMEER